MDNQVIELLTQQNELLSAIYTSLLFSLGCAAALLVVIVLYRFIKKFI